MRRFLPTLLALLFALNAVQGQGGFSDRIGNEANRGPSLAALEREAVKARLQGDVYRAMQLYSRIIAADSANVPALNGFAESAVDYSAFELAELTYQRLVDLNPASPEAVYLLRLADVKFRMGKYIEAKEVYQRTLNKPDGLTPEIVDQAQTGLENCDWAIDVMQNTDYELPVNLLGNSVNSSYSEFSPFSLKDTLYFSSYRFPFSNDDHKPERHLIKVMTATPQGDSLATAVADFNEKDEHVAHATFNEGGNTMYYCKCRFVGPVEIRCNLYARKRAADNTWGAAVKLPDHINVADFNNTQPNVGKLPGEKDEVLFFVSDRPGGKGKKDIWYSQIQSNGAYGQPVNLSELNTPGNDVSPFYHSNTGILYFSSDSYQSLGGFDIYKSSRAGSSWTAPEHLGSPINSGANDVYYSVTPNGRSAYFASNRLGAQNISEEACCYDIFEAQAKPEMIAITFHKITGDSLSKTEMRLIELADGKPVEEIKVQVPGPWYKFPVLPGKTYMLIASKPDFTTDTLTFTTEKTVWRDILVKKLYLRPWKVNLITWVYDAETKKELNGATAILVDLAGKQADGRIEARPDGSPLSTDTTTNPGGNRFDDPLQFDHRYRVLVSKPGYTVASTDVISTEGLFGDHTFERKLYIRRGVDLLALVYNELNNKPLKNVTFRLVDLKAKNTDTKTNPDGNDYRNILSFDSRYIIAASKPGYSSDSLEFNTTASLLKLDSFQTLEKKLYLHPLDLPSYLPIRLYFDNGEPEIKSWARTTKAKYSETYYLYINRKPDFIREYTAKLSGVEKERATAVLDSFFENDVKGEFNRLRKFTEVLYEKLKLGEKVTLTLKGFASPLAKSDYNKNLTARRIMCVMNHFSDFEPGLLNKYLKSGQLVVEEKDRGDDDAPKTVSDKKEDKRNSVYSVEASKERRVEIIGIDILKDGSPPLNNK